jgi:hypothetical protein
MAHGNGRAVPATTAETATRAATNSARAWSGFGGWRELEAEDRLALIECALKIPANDFADDLPLAL